MISDFSQKPKSIYKKAYRLAREASDQVLFVGDHAHRSAAGGADRSSNRFVECSSVRQAADYLKGSAAANDLILLKGSRNLHLERIALAFNHEVRCWEERCGLPMSCFTCGMFEFPFKQHATIREAVRRARSRYEIATSSRGKASARKRNSMKRSESRSEETSG